MKPLIGPNEWLLYCLRTLFAQLHNTKAVIKLITCLVDKFGK